MFNILRHKSKIGFDKVYCISYCRNIEKQKNITKIMKYLGIDFEFIYGADMSNLTILKHNDFYFEGGNKKETDWKYYTHYIGASYDHYTAIIHAYESGANSVLIFEDDCLFMDDKSYILNCLNNYPTTANFVKFGVWDWSNMKITYKDLLGNITTNNNVYIDVMNGTADEIFLGSQCYGVCSRETMKAYIDWQQTNFICCDLLYRRLGNSYALVPPIAIDVYQISEEDKKIYNLNEKFK